MPIIMRVYQLTRSEACEAAGSTQSEKMAWIAHPIGTRGSTVCLYGSAEAKVEARLQRKVLEEGKNGKGDPVKPLQKHAQSESTSSLAEGLKQKQPKQSKLKAFKKLWTCHSVQFEAAAIEAQALQATISANLPFRAFEDPEMLELFRMLRSAAPAIIPLHKVISGRLLDEAALKIERSLEKMFTGKEIGLLYINDVGLD